MGDNVRVLVIIYIVYISNLKFANSDVECKIGHVVEEDNIRRSVTATLYFVHEIHPQCKILMGLHLFSNLHVSPVTIGF